MFFSSINFITTTFYRERKEKNKLAGLRQRNRINERPGFTRVDCSKQSIEHRRDSVVIVGPVLSKKAEAVTNSTISNADVPIVISQQPASNFKKSGETHQHFLCKNGAKVKAIRKK